MADDSRPDHLRGPEWNGWEAVFVPGEIIFEKQPGEFHHDILINGKRVGWFEPRQAYCDRGRWLFGCELPYLDYADSFPRYYFDEDTALNEIAAFLNWRLWRRVP